MSELVRRVRARDKFGALPTFDVPFLILLLLLLSYGLIMLFSAGYAVALYRRGDAYTYIRPQLLFAALGVAAMYINVPDFPAADPLTALAVGIVSGLAATGADQVIKQIGNDN